MTSFLKLVIALCVSLILGLGFTHYALTQGYGFGAIQLGVWTAWPKTGSPEADPYARAVLARTGEIPLGLGEGLTLIARKDQSGQELSPVCSYRLSGRMPKARAWSLILTDQQGHVLQSDLGRYGFTSGEVVREEDLSLTIFISRNVHSGNWLAPAGQAPFLLVLKLYDTITRSNVSALEAADLPVLVREQCI
ncbi:MAG: DUF1214 domain-containing protein [Alphaproteobacteria bacterium]|nr:DUF1214 domain-containing protein [Alphaproteobacteria bacterium]